MAPSDDEVTRLLNRVERTREAMPLRRRISRK
jgi:hypothetical protein